NPPRGTTYYRFRAENDQGVAWSAPARTFILSSPPALAYDTPDNPVAFLRHTRARLNATLVDDCGMDTTAYALYWPVGDDASAVRVDLNFGDPVPEGPLSFDLSGLVPGATYSYVVAAVNGMGETRLATNAFTTVAASTPVFRYVGAEPSGSGDGSSYDNATDDFQWAIDYTEFAGDEIRLVAGTNTLDDTLNVANHPGLVIRGGYTADDVRGGWSCLRRDSSQSRRYRILAASASTLLIDSVGFADGAYETSLTYYGQAVSLINACTATFTNCLFRDNGVLALSAHSGNDGHTSQYGGALGASGGTLKIVDCAFRNNRIWGGSYNTQARGGAIGVYNAAVSILRSSFDANCTQFTHSRSGGGGAIYLHTCRDTTIAECHFTTNYCRTSTGNANHGYTQTGPFGGTLYLHETAATVTDCDITGGWIANGTQGGIYYGVGGVAFVSGASADVTFDRVRVHDCGFTGSTGNNKLNPVTQNDFCVASGRLTVRNSLFTRAYGSTQFCNRGGVLNVVNCTVTGGRGLATSRSQQTFVHTAGTTTNRNTIVWGNTGDALYVEAGATEPAVICCDMEEADPLFKDATAGDYHLKPGSPVRDKGDKTGFTRADIDLDHDRRIRGGRPDLGCFEGSLAGLFIIMR
ncbi:MAG: fibronectin type III domain-containing protein, partial [Kiritimatiellae bacterium]|nr:fibronectin type III domain-containing protein [Kiritimatiellia bacterium]